MNYNDIYRELDYYNGNFLDVTKASKDIPEEWLNIGDWILSAKIAGAKKIFFVENNPVIICSECDKNSLIKHVTNIWNLARPRILFLECNGELLIIDLAKKPNINNKKNEVDCLNKFSLFDLIDKVTKKINEKYFDELNKYHRNNIESGYIFELEKNFGDLETRADKSLISDLKTIRERLLETRLKASIANKLIACSIFIRYLEDRKIINEDYFNKIVNGNDVWNEIIKQKVNYEQRNIEKSSLYARVLNNKDFTYALFYKLSTDFNGNMFPIIEEDNINQAHLSLIQQLMYGDAKSQDQLFFNAYNFEIIPIELISAIYEEFYSSEKQDEEEQNEKDNKSEEKRQNGVYYTPLTLAEFVVSKVLTQDVLINNPTILDPACGSGIFLVEAFRRISRFKFIELNNNEKKLTFLDLKSILEKQIFGMELNPEAAEIAAFSLCIALLNYLDPPSILQQLKENKKLPILIDNDKGNIKAGNSFVIKHDQKFDVIIGNPPWGSPGKKATKEIKAEHQKMVKWCKNNKFPIGDSEYSQGFLWLAYTFLKDGGSCGLLTSAGVLFKHHDNSIAFRKEWMNKVNIIEVFNFSHVRTFFFHKAISPFIIIHFKNEQKDKKFIQYWSAKQTSYIKNTQAVLLSIYDRAIISEQDLSDKKTWKINYFGRNNDERFIKHLDYYLKLNEFIDKKNSGRGFEKLKGKFDSDWLINYNELPTKQLSRYCELSNFCLPPKKVSNRGKSENIYKGNRLLIKRGITQLNKKNKLNLSKCIISRYVDNDFCFRNSIYSIKLKDHYKLNYFLLLQGILWSSFACYFYFHTASNWGLWHYEIHYEELLDLPLPNNLDGDAAQKIIEIVNKLRAINQDNSTLNNDTIISELEGNLDEAVYNLYKFNPLEIGLIKDCCKVTIPFFYDPEHSIGKQKVIINNDTNWIENYAKVFSKCWRPYIDKNNSIRANVFGKENDIMLAIKFYPADLNDEWDLVPKNEPMTNFINKIGDNQLRNTGVVNVFIDGIVYFVSDNSIMIIKRNEKRFWTCSMAREDAEATLFEAMKGSESKGELK